MDFLANLVGGFLSQFWQPIAAGVGLLLAGFFAYMKGKKDQAQKGKIAVQKETIDAHDERDEIDDAIAGATPAERKRMRDKWTRNDG